MQIELGSLSEACIREQIDFAVKRRFRKPGAVFGRLWKEPTVHSVNRPLVVEPLVRAVQIEKDLSLDDVKEGI